MINGANFEFPNIILEFRCIHFLAEEKANSIGFKCGQYGGRKITIAPISITASTSSWYICIFALSSIRIDRGKG